MPLLSSCRYFAAGGGPAFQALLDAFYGGEPCPLTEAELQEGGGGPA